MTCHQHLCDSETLGLLDSCGLILGCMQQQRRATTVHVHYKGTLDDGSSSIPRRERSDLLTPATACDSRLPRTAIEGMSIGDKKTSRMEPSDAYGYRREELVFSVGKDQMPEGRRDRIGDMLQVGFPDGTTPP